jgi:hypothetical protein
VIGGEFVEDAAAFLCDGEDHAARVFGVFAAFDEALAHGAIDEFNDTVVLQAEAFGGVGDRGEGVGGFAGDLEEELVLLWLDAGVRCGAFAVEEESAELEAELG